MVDSDDNDDNDLSNGSICTACGLRRPAAAFPPRGRRCLDCRRAAQRAHYRDHRGYYLAKARRHQQQQVVANRAWLTEYLRAHPCLDCGNADLRVLEFDHRDAATKARDVAVLVGQGYGLDRVKTEVAKCDVRCANCHRIRTRSQRGWWGGAEA